MWMARASATSPTARSIRPPTARWPSGWWNCTTRSPRWSRKSSRRRPRSKRPSSVRTPSSTLKLGLARGVALLVPALAGLAVAEYPANLVKKSIVGAGHAEKDAGPDDGAPPAAGLPAAIGRRRRRARRRHLPRPSRLDEPRAGKIAAGGALMIAQAHRRHRLARAPTRRSSMSAASAISCSARRAA